ncbi:MAG: hypothetical protein CV087_20270 [Candidatus Brocadia sp. WS118]|nr:MAG: hypothetical protein CV087_20270 [Candidatus Brocadia sp. WS118]
MHMGLLPLVVLLLSVPFVAVYAESIQPIQHTDIAELMMKKHIFTADGRDFTVFYKLSTIGGVGESTSEDHNARIMSMEIDKENTSLVIHMEDVMQDDVMSIKFQKEMLSAEGNRFVILADGKEKKYEYYTQEDATGVIFVLPKDTSQVEIIGTRVIPEFQSVLLILVAVISVVLIAIRAKLPSYQTW